MTKIKFELVEEGDDYISGILRWFPTTTILPDKTLYYRWLALYTSNDLPQKQFLLYVKLSFINEKLIHGVVVETMGTKLRTVGCRSWGSRPSGKFCVASS